MSASVTARYRVEGGSGSVARRVSSGANQPSARESVAHVYPFGRTRAAPRMTSLKSTDRTCRTTDAWPTALLDPVPKPPITYWAKTPGFRDCQYLGNRGRVRLPPHSWVGGLLSSPFMGRWPAGPEGQGRN